MLCPKSSDNFQSINDDIRCAVLNRRESLVTFSFLRHQNPQPMIRVGLFIHEDPWHCNPIDGTLCFSENQKLLSRKKIDLLKATHFHTVLTADSQPEEVCTETYRHSRVAFLPFLPFVPQRFLTVRNARWEASPSLATRRSRSGRPSESAVEAPSERTSSK